MATIALDARPAMVAPASSSQSRYNRLELAALLGIVLIAVLLRFPSLNAAPPALADDEAINGLDIYRIFNGYHEPFFPNNNGREGLFIYVQAGTVALFGASPWSLRIVSAVAGVGAVLATWAMARSMFGRWVGILAAGILATLLWHVILSRVGLRAITSPVILALGLWMFWRVLRDGRLRDGAWLGLIMGLGLQTYLSTRLVPLVFLLVLAFEWATNRWLLPARLRSLLLGVGIAIVLLAPLGWYYVRHPEDAIERQAQVMIGSDSPQGDTRYSTVLDSIPRTLEMFNLHGDENWRHNIGGRPAFDPVTGALFLLGIAVAVRFIGQSWPATAHSAGDVTAIEATGSRQPRLHPYAWLLSAFPILLLPGFVTIESPHFLRTDIVLPVLATLPAIGAVGIWQSLRRRLAPACLSHPVVRYGPPVAGALFVLTLAVTTYRLYWNEWATSIRTWQSFTGSANPLMDFLRGYEAEGGDLESVQISLPPMPPINQPPAEIGYSMLLDPYFPPLPSMAFLMPEVKRTQRLDLASTILPLHGPLDRDQVYVVSGPDRYDLPSHYFPEAQLVARPPGPDGWPAYIRVDVPAAAVQARLGAMEPLDVDYGQVRLIGAVVSPGGPIRAGESATVDLRWRVEQAGEINYGPGAVLVDADGVRWADDDKQGAVLGGWQPGDEFLSRHVLVVPSDAPPGQYHVEAALSRRSLFPQPSQIIRSLGRPVDVGQAAVSAPDRIGEAPPPIGHSDGRALTPSATLDQVAPPPTSSRPGDELSAIVRWRVHGELPATALQVVQAGRVIASSATAEAYDGSRWLRRRYPVHIPPTASAGDATLRLVALAPDGAVVNSLDLGTTNIEARDRVFTAQPMSTPAEVRFDDRIALAGWSVAQSCDATGRTVAVTFQWQALTEMEKPYTVFLHVLGPGGAIAAQRDSQPRGGEYPTSAWQGGEYVVDRFDVTIPAASRGEPIRVIAGLYDAVSGQRLPTTPGTDAGADHAIIAPTLDGC